MPMWAKRSFSCENNKLIINILQLKFASHVNLTISSVDVDNLHMTDVSIRILFSITLCYTEEDPNQGSKRLSYVNCQYLRCKV